MILLQKRRRSIYKVRFCRQRNRSEKSIKILIIKDAISSLPVLVNLPKNNGKRLEQLGRNGLVSVEEDTAMQNHENRNVLCRLSEWTRFNGYGISKCREMD